MASRRQRENTRPLARNHANLDPVANYRAKSPSMAHDAGQTFRPPGLVLRCVIAGYVLAAGGVLPWRLSVVSGMIAGCDRFAAAGGSAGRADPGAGGADRGAGGADRGAGGRGR